MDHEFFEELEVPSAVLTSVAVALSTETEKEKLSVISVNAVSEVTDPRLGLPNPTSQCFSCGARDLRSCEGHFGVIKFPYTIQHPYFLSEIIKVLNKICPGCKSPRQDKSAKRTGSTSERQQQKGCRYCSVNSDIWYPKMKFKVSSEDLSRRTAIVVEIDEKLPKKFQKSRLEELLPANYWSFIPTDPQYEEISTKPTRRVLSHAQVHYLLQDVDEEVIKKFISRADLLFLNYFPVTPNSHRVTEIHHAFSNGQRLIFDERTRVYRKLVDVRGTSNELSADVYNCLKISKLHLDKLSSKDPASEKKNSDVSKSSGSRWIKEVFLGKRNDNSFRMVVTGDPNLKLTEIGIPRHVAERLQISEHLNTWNWERLNANSSLRLLEKGEVLVRRKGSLVRLKHTDALQMGDAIYRPLSDGDLVLVNRPPSIHPHSLIALSVRVLPVSSVVSINPLCCSPFRGDFDGDCFHGYIPQSLDAQIELHELVTLDRQLINKQNGRNLLSFSQDSLLAAYLLLEDDVRLSHSQMQQLQMFCPQQLESTETTNDAGIGKQLFSMLLPPDFEYTFPSRGGSAWLRDNDSNLFKRLINHYQGKVLDFLFDAQELLNEWLSMRGLTVSLSDLYLTSDSCLRKTMMDDVFYGLQEAEQTCNFKQLMVGSSMNFLMSAEDNEDAMVFGAEHLCYEKQRSAALSQASVDAFKQVFWDIQNLAYRYADKENSLLTMFKAGSKGNLLKLVQHSMSLGLQHSLAPLSFRFPFELTCDAWNALRADDTAECAKSYIPYAVIENSFLTGLNPLESFAHSVTSRDCSFSDHAELPGTLTRRLMFFLRDLYTAYDGTVRNAYGDQVVQLSYDIGDSTCDGGAGESVGALSACALSEVAYSALDQPISLLETSPLLNLKNVLECGSKKGKAEQTMSLYLSKKLGSQRHGFELGALEIKNHLECLIFSDIVSTVTIMYSPQTSRKLNFSPWVCHFYVSKDIMKRRRLKVNSIIDCLHRHRNSAGKELKINLPNLEISVKEGSSSQRQNECDGTLCITVTAVETSKKSSVPLDKIRSLLIPLLLNCVIKGFREIKKVEILWKDGPKSSKTRDASLGGELYLRVSMTRDSTRTNLWRALMNDCLHIMNMIDWTRSHPDNIHNFCSAYGIDAGLNFFLNNLKSAVSDTGKTVLPQHLLLVADSLSATGEFVGLNSKGITQQREHASVSSPFMQACFSSPGACFIKAAKTGVVDNLQGSIEALSWGKVPSIGTGGHFDIVYSGEGTKVEKPVDVYNLLAMPSSPKENVNREENIVHNHVSDKFGAPFAFSFAGSAPKGLQMIELISRSLVKKCITQDDIQKLSRTLKNILYKYPIDHVLSEGDKIIALMALCFHPRKNEKIGTGAQEIKVVNHPEYPSTRCFSVVRKDGTMEDFSYHKCIVSALEVIAPRKAKSYKSRWLKLVTANNHPAPVNTRNGCTGE